MYNDYFGFSDAPFSIAPNPHFLYMSSRHREALAHLLYGIRSDGGFILLTGEVGTGKTTVCRCLLEQMPDNVDTAFVLNPKLTATELLATACDDLGVSYPGGASIKQLVDALNAYLLESLNNGRRTVLIIDEAQNLSTDVLEQLRLLTNLETNQRKLLQIILLGQPELLDILARQDMRQLSQRITARFHLDSLAPEDIEHYIGHRIEVAGGNPALFSKAAVKRVYQLSGGVPRLVNLICDRALLGTYAEDRLRVEPAVVDKAAREILGNAAPRPGRSWPWGLAAGVLLAALSTAALLNLPPQAERTPDVPQSTAAQSTPPAEPEASPPAEPPRRPEPEIVEAPPEEIVTANLIEAEPALRPDPLLAVQGESTRNAGIARLLLAWQAPLADGDDACELASQYQLRCFETIGSLHDIEQLNRPAVIRLTLALEDHFVTVTGVGPDLITLTSSEGRFRVRREDVLATWDGRYTVLWRTPPEYREIARGDSGALVEQLSRQLALVSDGPVTTTFDEALEDRLKRFQISVGLRPDGIAGAQTWIHLNQAAGLNAPTLNRERA